MKKAKEDKKDYIVRLSATYTIHEADEYEAEQQARADFSIADLEAEVKEDKRRASK